MDQTQDHQEEFIEDCTNKHRMRCYLTNCEKDAKYWQRPRIRATLGEIAYCEKHIEFGRKITPRAIWLRSRDQNVSHKRRD